MSTRWIRFLIGVLVAGLCARVYAQSCPGDLNGDNEVTVDELLTAVNASLNGCMPPPPTFTANPPPTPTHTPSATKTPTLGPTLTPTPRFRDSGNGTITDTTTGLVWQKQGDDGGLTDKDSRYSWSRSGSVYPDGSAFSFLSTLNAVTFGGYRDWRLPTLEELQTIVSRGAIPPGQPVVPEAFSRNCVPGCNVMQCSCTKALNYWSSTSNAANVQQAWNVLFNTGDSSVGFKTIEMHVRAVRGGR